MSADAVLLSSGQRVAIVPISPGDPNKLDDDNISVSSTSTRERRNSFTVTSSINDNVLATSIQLFPPAREHLLRETGSSPSSRNSSPSRTSSPVERRGLSLSPQRGIRPSEGLMSPDMNAMTLGETSLFETKAAPPSATKSSSSSAKVEHRRGTMLGPFMFMAKDTDKRVLEKFTPNDVRTMVRQMQLLEIQIRERQERDRKILEDKILRSWHVVHELEDGIKASELEDEAAEDLVYTHNQLNHMINLLDQMNSDVVPVFEKLHDYHRMKSASAEKQKFMKSIKSFNLRTRVNQEYSDKILTLEAGVKHLERMNEKKERMLQGKLLSHIQRINSSASNSPMVHSPAPRVASGRWSAPRSRSSEAVTPKGSVKFSFTDVDLKGDDVFSPSFARDIGARTVSEHDIAPRSDPRLAQATPATPVGQQLDTPQITEESELSISVDDVEDVVGHVRFAPSPPIGVSAPCNVSASGTLSPGHCLDRQKEPLQRSTDHVGESEGAVAATIGCDDEEPSEKPRRAPRNDITQLEEASQEIHKYEGQYYHWNMEAPIGEPQHQIYWREDESQQEGPQHGESEEDSDLQHGDARRQHKELQRNDLSHLPDYQYEGQSQLRQNSKHEDGLMELADPLPEEPQPEEPQPEEPQPEEPQPEEPQPEEPQPEEPQPEEPQPEEPQPEEPQPEEPQPEEPQLEELQSEELQREEATAWGDDRVEKRGTDAEFEFGVTLVDDEDIGTGARSLPAEIAEATSKGACGPDETMSGVISELPLDERVAAMLGTGTLSHVAQLSEPEGDVNTSHAASRGTADAEALASARGELLQKASLAGSIDELDVDGVDGLLLSTDLDGADGALSPFTPLSPPPTYASVTPAAPALTSLAAQSDALFSLQSRPTALDTIFEEDPRAASPPAQASLVPQHSFEASELPAYYEGAEISVLDLPDHHLDDNVSVLSSDTSASKKKKRPTMKGLVKRTRSILGLMGGRKQSERGMLGEEKVGGSDTPTGAVGSVGGDPSDAVSVSSLGSSGASGVSAASVSKPAAGFTLFRSPSLQQRKEQQQQQLVGAPSGGSVASASASAASADGGAQKEKKRGVGKFLRGLF